MEADKIVSLYDEDYAEAYDDRFIHNRHYKHVADFELAILTLLLNISSNWLDVGCGTGYFMSKFPGVPRGGLDLSESMLGVARKRNPDALFLRQGDFRAARPDWNQQWDLVSCMWCAYCYVESMTDIDKVIRNLADWTADAGVCFLPICDLEDVIYGRGDLKHHNPDIQIFGGPCYVNAVTWTYIDNLNKKKHENLISPHIEYLTRLLHESFSRVDVVYYPPYPRPIPGQRKALIASGKRGTLTPPKMAILESILERSRDHRENVLTMEKLEGMLQGAGGDGVNDLNKGHQTSPEKVGWVRRAWRTSPPRLREMVRKLIGEG